MTSSATVAGGRPVAFGRTATLLPALVLACACHSGGDERPSVLLVSLDTTRADRLGPYGGNATPTLDRLANEGVTFDGALTPTPVTLPAHATLMTGLLPQRHGVRDNGLFRLPSDLPTLAGELADAGYDTRAVIGAAVLDRQYGLARGFGDYDDRVAPVGGLAVPERSATGVTDAALAAAENLRPPFLLFVHYFDAHAPYRPPTEFGQGAGRDPYDGEIAYIDHELGRLIAGLEQSGLMRNTIVAVVSDHGESLGEHGEPTHGVFLYQTTLRVPFILRAPGSLPQGARAEQLVTLADVAPTLLQLTETPIPPALDGHSLVSELVRSGNIEQQRWLPIETETGYNAYGFAALRGVTDGRLKWIDAPRPELYDLIADPSETRNLILERPEVTEELRRLRSSIVVEDHRASAPGEPEDEDQSEHLRRLASLGYVSASRRSPATDRQFPDPKDVVFTLELTNRARSLIVGGRPEQAAEILERVLEETPGNLNAMILLGMSRTLAGESPEAIPVLQRAASLAPHMADVHFILGAALLKTGDPPGAEAAWRMALQVSPRYLEAAANLIDLLLVTGRVDDAARALAEARAEGLDDPLVDYLEGRVALAAGEPERARAALGRASNGTLPPEIARDTRVRLRQLRN